MAQAQTADSTPTTDPWARGLDWPVVLWITLVHLGALAAPFFFTWKGLLLALVFGWLFGSLGICLGYHRLLTHGSFRTFRPVRWLFAWLMERSGLAWDVVRPNPIGPVQGNKKRVHPAETYRKNFRREHSSSKHI